MSFKVNVQQAKGNARQITIDLYQILFEKITIQIGSRALDFYNLTGEKVKLEPSTFDIDQGKVDEWFRIAQDHNLIKTDNKGNWHLEICKRKEFFNAPHLRFTGFDLFIPSLHRTPESLIKIFRERLIRRMKGLLDPVPYPGFRVVPG